MLNKVVKLGKIDLSNLNTYTMKKQIKTNLLIFYLSFIASFVGSLFGLVINAFWLGYRNRIITHTIKRNDVLPFIMNILVMEIGFFISAWLHADLVYELSRGSTIAIGLSLGLISFFLGAYLKRYEIAKNSYPLRHKKFKWYQINKIPVLK